MVKEHGIKLLATFPEIMASEIFTKRKFLKKLKNAATVCLDCGSLYGRSSPWSVTCWHSACDICGNQTIVSDVRDHGYLRKGINLLEQEILDLQTKAKQVKREP